jgi:transposase
MADQPLQVILGVDTHAEVHVAAVLDHLGRLQVTLAIPTTGRLSAAAGLGWSPRPAHPGWGEGHRHLRRRPDPLADRRRRPGDRGRPAQPPAPPAPWQSDPTDAEAAARAVLAGEATATPKTRSGIVGDSGRSPHRS